MRSATILAFAVFALVGFQDPVFVNPKIASVVIENDRVRVLRVHTGPHERFEMHSHPALLVVSLTDSSRRAYLPDGTYRDTKVALGDVHWREPSTHAVENLLDTPYENIEIEFKNAKEPAVAIRTVPAPAVSSESSAAVPVEQEPLHHVILQNQYVRVLDVTIPPGISTLFHTHEHDNFSIRVSDGLVQTQTQGKDWQPPSPLERGSVVFSKGSNQHYTHRVKNMGTVPYHVIDVELLP
jgi:quercetin dioxygenase-like cupin family protein